MAEALLERAAAAGLALVKLHCHPNGYPRFSPTDDISDYEFFQSVYGWIDDDGPHVSAVMLPNGSIFGRVIGTAGEFRPLDRILVAGHDIGLFDLDSSGDVPDHAQRHAQLFGERTTNLLRRLRVGVVGCSGTGSFVIEMLGRLGVGHLVLVDPDKVEARNLNRIVGTAATDIGRPKVEALADYVRKMGTGTRVHPLQHTVLSREAVKALAACDVVFGCVDSHDGRRALNRLATFYVQPYLDCGVGLTSDGNGDISEIAVASHYIQPGRSSLLGRRAIRPEVANAQAIARQTPDAYKALRAEGYIANANVDSPAVISVNGLAASLCVNEFLARLHPFRLQPNETYAAVRLNVADMYIDLEKEGDEQPVGRALGRGDVEPLLDVPELSQPVEAR